MGGVRKPIFHISGNWHTLSSILVSCTSDTVFSLQVQTVQQHTEAQSSACEREQREARPSHTVYGAFHVQYVYVCYCSKD